MKFIHIADVHLGATPDLGFSWSKQREKEIWDSFSRVIEQVKKEKIELLLVAGDLFHGQPLIRECKELNFLLEQIPDTAVVLIAGNHDHIKSDSAYIKFPWAKNVIGLWGDKCQTCYIESCNTYVYGFSYHEREILQPVYNQIFPKGNVNLRTEHADANHILLAHGGDEKHVPIRFNGLANTDFDYIALGHIHQPQILSANKMAYAGSLEPLDKNHIGQRGYIKGEIINGRTDIVFVPFSRREYRELQIHVTPNSSNGSIQSDVEQQIQKQGRQHIYRIHLTGYKDPELDIWEENLEKLGNVVEIRDDTEPEYDFEQLKNKYAGTAVAAYINSFVNRETMSDVEKKALWHGVWALLKAGE